MAEKTKTESVNEATPAEEAKQVNPATDVGNYAVVVSHPDGMREVYAVVTGTVQIAPLGSGSFGVR